MSETVEYIIHVKTGDKKFAGTDANVTLVLFGPNGQKSNDITLDNFFRNDFESGQKDSFEVEAPNFPNVERIELWRDEAGILANWFVDTVEVVNTISKEVTIFPLFRWIKPNYRYKIIHLDTSLPQFEHFKDQRAMELHDKKQIYELNVKIKGMTAQVILNASKRFCQNLILKIPTTPKSERALFEGKSIHFSNFSAAMTLHF